MNAKLAFILAACLSLAGALSCAKEKATRDPGKSGAPEAAPRESQEIPIDAMPKVLNAPVNYPEESRARGDQGMVQVKALVGKDGRVVEAAVDSTQTAPAALRRAAVEAVRQWTFEPARAKGEPVEVWVVVPVNFRLH